jgi:hypothetical protein
MVEVLQPLIQHWETPAFNDFGYLTVGSLVALYYSAAQGQTVEFREADPAGYEMMRRVLFEVEQQLIFRNVSEEDYKPQ